MSKTGSGSQAEIVRLSKMAHEAAQQGRWDEVIQCYAERGLLLASTPTSTLPTDELLKMDDDLRNRIYTVQALLEELLADVQMTKRQVQGLRQRLAISPSGPEALSVEA